MKKIISIINFILTIIVFIILFFTNVSEKFVNIITLSLIIGWIMPYFSLLISGLTIYLEKHLKMSLVFNILSFLVSIFLIYLCLKIYTKSFLNLIINYILISIINVINIFYLIIYLKKHPDLEMKKIKIQKKAHNGIIK